MRLSIVPCSLSMDNFYDDAFKSEFTEAWKSPFDLEETIEWIEAYMKRVEKMVQKLEDVFNSSTASRMRNSSLSSNVSWLFSGWFVYCWISVSTEDISSTKPWDWCKWPGDMHVRADSKEMRMKLVDDIPADRWIILWMYDEYHRRPRLEFSEGAVYSLVIGCHWWTGEVRNGTGPTSLCSIGKRSNKYQLLKAHLVWEKVWI